MILKVIKTELMIIMTQNWKKCQVKRVVAINSLIVKIKKNLHNNSRVSLETTKVKKVNLPLFKKPLDIKL
jgi:hypothetical protein